MGLKEAEDIDFKYTTMSLNKVYETGMKHALQNVEKNGGKINGDMITIKIQQPRAVAFERSFPDLYPVNTIPATWNDKKDELSFSYTGTGFALRGETAEWGNNSSFVFNTELYVDGKLIETPQLPTSYTTRRYDLCWKYDLPKGSHEVKLKILNPSTEHNFRAGLAIIYDNVPSNGVKANELAAKKP